MSRGPIPKGVSKNSRAVGAKQLVEMGLLKVTQRPLGPFPDASLFNPLYTRSVYSLTVDN